MRNIHFSKAILLTIIGISTSALAIPIYVVDDHWSFWGGYSSKIVVMDSEAPHNEVTLNSDTGKRMTDIAITPSGSRLYTITGDGYASLYRFDVEDGRLLDSWRLGIGGTGFKNALVAESETSLLLMSNDKKKLWRINLDDAGSYVSIDVVGNVGLYSSGDLAISPDGVLYLSSVDRKNSSTARNRLYTIDLTGNNPVATEVGIIHDACGNLTQIYGLAFDENGVLYGGRGAVGVAEDVYTINLNDASATYSWTMQCMPPTGINGFASTAGVTPVPEPATLFLLVLGIPLLIKTKKGR